VRLFVAVRLPPDVAVRTSAVLPQMRSLRPVQPQLMHVTLAFLGATLDERLDDVIAAAREAAAASRPFRLSLDTVGRFPERGSPHVAWLGIGEGSAEIGALAAALRAALVSRGIAFDAKPFRAHVALARVRERADREEARQVGVAIRAAAAPAIAFTADALSVVESKLSPKGPIYTDRATLRLGTGTER
jgi:RNA 2',3'-cyclic 3'-phosphodiesterase